MSWLDTVNNQLEITTGDGQLYVPFWVNAVKAKEFNTSEFEFVETVGTLVKRKTPKGRRYNIEIYFQGDDHLVESQAFDNSSDDPRPWNISHPVYGRILVQPLSLSFDNSQFNVTKITGTLVETIDESNPKITVNPVDRIFALNETFNLVCGDAYALQQFSAADIVQQQNTLNTLYENGKKIIKETSDLEKYLNLYNDAYSDVVNVTEDALQTINKIQVFINAPFQFVDSVKNRVNTLISQFNALVGSIGILTGVTSKRIFESNVGTVVASIAAAMVTDYSYANRNEVMDTIDQLTDVWDDFIEAIDSLQSDNGGNPDSYIPDAGTIKSLSDLINYTISNLFVIASSSKQERVVYVDEDTNLTLLTHRYYGLDAEDKNIETMMNDNNIGLNEILAIKKDRRIVYYV